MGACVSSHKKSSSPMKLHKSSSEINWKTDNDMVIPLSPVKEKLPIVVNNGNVAVKPQFPPLHSSADSPDFGSKEETFFDSQAWLDSDCESDFMSVNGEFTPSIGNTPVHHDFLIGTPQMKDSAPAVDDQKPSVTPSQPSVNPIKKKKRLSELFSESRRENHNLDEESEENDENFEQASEKAVVENRDATAVHGSGLKVKRERWVEIVQVNGCLPRVLSSCRPVTHQQTQVRRK